MAVINVENQPLSEQEAQHLQQLLQRACNQGQLLVYAQDLDESGVDTRSGNGIYSSDSFSVDTLVVNHERSIDQSDPLGKWEEYEIPEVHIGLTEAAVDVLYGDIPTLRGVEQEGIRLIAREQ